MHDRHPIEDDDAPGLSRRTVLLSIGGFWAFYGAIVTLRSVLVGQGDQVEMLVRRIGVLAVSMALTWLMYLALRRTSAASLRRRIAGAALLAVPAAMAFALANWVGFDVLERPAPAAASPASAQAMVQVGGVDDAAVATLKMAADKAVNGYFFFAGWAALYLALVYAAEVRALERKAGALRIAAQTAELRALRYQVNPHFLFNTFNSLSSLVMTGQREAAERTIINLSSFFRASLTGDPSEDVRLEDEIRLQRLYLEIEQVRFPARLRTDIVLPDRLRGAMVLGLILQPLVENAVKHGVSRSRQPVLVTIEAAERDGRLVLEVADNGDTRTSGDAAESGLGLGLRNVRDRLAARFGAAAELAVQDRGAEGFAVTLTLPLVLEER